MAINIYQLGIRMLRTQFLEVEVLDYEYIAAMRKQGMMVPFYVLWRQVALRSRGIQNGFI